MSTASTGPDLRQIGGTAFVEVLTTLWSLPATLRDLNDQNHRPIPPPQIASTVHLKGPRISGSVCVQMPLAFAAQAIRPFTGLDGTAPEPNALLEDMAGELANMVAGRVAAQLRMGGYPSSLDTPTICRGGGCPSEAGSGKNHARIEVLCDGHWLSLELQCRYANP